MRTPYYEYNDTGNQINICPHCKVLPIYCDLQPSTYPKEQEHWSGEFDEVCYYKDYLTCKLTDAERRLLRVEALNE